VGEYLNDTNHDNNAWQCAACPDGADCTASDSLPTFDTLQPLNGYHALSWDPHTFGACPVAAACNNSLSNGSCALGHNATASELCNQCAHGYAQIVRGETCEACPETSVTVLLMCGAVLLAMGLFGFLVWDALDGANDMIENIATHRAAGGDRTVHHINLPFHSIVIRIVSSYLQIAGMLLQFDLQLPPSVRALVVVETLTSSLSESLLSIDCATSVRKDSELFLMKQLASVWGIPLCAVVVCGVFWGGVQIWVFGRKESKMTGLDGFLSSLMVLFYTLFPSVVSRVAMTFSCQKYGIGVQERSLLAEALSVECNSLEHWALIGYIGIPGILM
jgi:hypothetical protein